MPQEFAGLKLDRPLIMGIVNVTPDSFSDGGRFFDPHAAVAQGERLIADGADILDVGGESTRPGAEPVAPEEEQRRILPAIRALAGKGAAISVDTRHAATMRAALAAGAIIVNDVTALTGDPDALGAVAEAGAAVALMHMAGEPRTMQANPRYANVVEEVYAYLAGRILACRAAGIPPERIAVDPGIGFGKNDSHNLALLAHIDRFEALGCAVMVGASRKGFISRLSRNEEPERRLGGSLAAALWGASRGARILRVHDVAETVQALKIWREIGSAG